MIKIINSIINVVFIIIIVILGGYFILRAAGVVTMYQVATGSMGDTIKIDDYVLSIKQKSYKEGDAITFKYNDNFVTHRIVKIDGDKIITKGDANNDPDEEINISQVTGKVLISGGLLNYIVGYKFVIVAFMLMLYLITWLLDYIEVKELETKEKLAKLEKQEN